MAQRGPARPTARIEEAIGFVGMFGILFLGVTVFCEVTGRPALGWALTLLVCVAGVVLLDRWRVSVLRRTAPDDGIGRSPAASAPVHPGRTAGRPAASVRAAATPSATAPSADGRVHRHVGWDELAPAGRRQTHAARRTPVTLPAPTSATATAPAPARTGPVTDVTRPSDG